MRRVRSLLAGVIGISLITMPAGAAGAPARADPAPTTLPMQVQRAGHLVIAGDVEVGLDGHRYRFRVDSGDSSTAISASVARQLGLSHAGRSVGLQTVGCVTSGQAARLPELTLGGTTIRNVNVISQPGLLGTARPRPGQLAGLLGSDVLSRFGTVTLDLQGARLQLGSGGSSAGGSIPLTVLRGATGATLETVPVTIHGTGARLVFDTGSPLTLFTGGTAARLGLPSVHMPTKVRGATGCSAKVSAVAITDWSSGGVTLPSTVGVSAGSGPRHLAGRATDGLIGLSVFSGYRTITLDFAHGRLLLGHGTGGGGAPVIPVVIGALVLMLLAVLMMRRQSRL